MIETVILHGVKLDDLYSRNDFYKNLIDSCLVLPKLNRFIISGEYRRPIGILPFNIVEIILANDKVEMIEIN